MQGQCIGKNNIGQIIHKTSPSLIEVLAQKAREIDGSGLAKKRCEVQAAAYKDTSGEEAEGDNRVKKWCRMPKHVKIDAVWQDLMFRYQKCPWDLCGA